jgi:MOSC domain-containing protein YiiM
VKLTSVNTGLPRDVTWHGRTVRTSIWKAPVEGPVRVETLNLEGDRQSDLTVHGGPDKAVYLYPSEHYEYWRAALPDADLPWGVFGENFTTEGLLEAEVRIGDLLRAGSAAFVVTQPRMPCFKLGIRFKDDHMVKRFLRSGRTGFYVKVVREGQVAAGDAIELSDRDSHGVTVRDITSLYTDDAGNRELRRRALQVPALPESWKDFLGR